MVEKQSVSSRSAVVAGTLLMVLIAALFFGKEARAADNGLAEKPLMGWSSYSLQVYNEDGINWVTAARVKAQSDAMAAYLQDYGYEYINIDAGWDGGIDGYGRPVPKSALYPDGIQDVIDYVHDNGQKIGLYTIPGLPKAAYDNDTPILGTSCTARDIVVLPLRSADYWDINYKIDFANPCAQSYIDSIADLFGDWGIDFLKFDSVTPGSGHYDTSIDARGDVAAWAQALAPHNIWFTLSWAVDYNYAAYWREHANAWRVQWDVECYCGPYTQLTKWENIARLFPDADKWWREARPGGWNDFDSLNVGNGSMDGLTPDERRTAMGLWAMSSAQLYIGNDMTNLDGFGLELLTNEEVIAVNQAGRPAHPVSTATDRQVWYANNGDGSYTVGLFNLGGSSATVTVDWSDIGLSGGATVRDLWSRTDLGTFNTGFSSINLPSHGSRLLRVVSLGGYNSVNDDDTGIAYTGDWRRNTNRGFGDYKDDVHFTQNNGDYVEFSFTGTGVNLITERSTGQGEMDIYVDGAYKTTVNAYASSMQAQQQLYGITGLPHGPHTIKAVKKNGTYMIIDRFNYSVASPVRVNNTHPDIAYGGTWSLNSGRGFGDYMDDVHFTETNDDYFTYAFNGTGIELITEKSTGQGQMDIYIDNVLQTTVDAYHSSMLAQQTLYRIDGLAAGAHTLKAVKKSGAYMILDRLNVLNNQLVYNNTDPGIVYSGGWSLNSNRGYGDYNDDVHFSEANDTQFEFTFVGTGIDVVMERSTGQGNVDFYIDNVFRQTVDTYNGTMQTQVPAFSVSGLSSGAHTVKGVKKSGTYMILDALRVTP
ncbi:glycoside hydrolase family 27 protein [Cohnella cellulosilytica]|uniref:Alpha-galactosidase n=1 Tax=Cohnella cellulosilytica TaxID=986710 RepID=A0ABW2F4M9_9BACL